MCLHQAFIHSVYVRVQEHLGLVVLGLLRQGKFHFLAALRESLLSFLKAKVKGIVSGYLQGETLGEEPASLAECMRGMQFEAWLEMLKEVFDRMLQCQSAVQVLYIVIWGGWVICAGLSVRGCLCWSDY